MSIDNIPDFMKNMLKEQYVEINDIIEGFNVRRMVTLRVNTLKTSIANMRPKEKEKLEKIQ